MGSKYGRLFTERDVLAVVDEALVVSPNHFAGERMEDVLRVLIDRAEADKAPMTFPPDEPLFLLRGKDKAAPEALDGDGYYEALYAVDADPKFRLKVAGAALEIREWQAEHLDLVKVPD